MAPSPISYNTLGSQRPLSPIRVSLNFPIVYEAPVRSYSLSRRVGSYLTSQTAVGGIAITEQWSHVSLAQVDSKSIHSRHLRVSIRAAHCPDLEMLRHSATITNGNERSPSVHSLKLVSTFFSVGLKSFRRLAQSFFPVTSQFIRR